MKLKKIMAMVLAVLMVTSLLAGCAEETSTDITEKNNRIITRRYRKRKNRRITR